MGTKNKVPPVGKNKVRAVTQQKAALPHHTSGGRGKKSDYAKELEFKLTDPTGQLPKPTFNVLYVQTPRIGFMQVGLGSRQVTSWVTSWVWAVARPPPIPTQLVPT